MPALKVISQGSPAIDFDPDDIAMHLPSDAQLVGRAGEAILAGFAEHLEAVSLYGDRLMGDRRQARPAWSPTRVLSEPGFSLPLAVRASWAGFDSSMTPVELELRLAETNAPVLHLPTVLTRHSESLSPRGEPMADDPRFEPGPRSGTRRLKPSPQGQAITSIVIPSAGISQPGAETTMLACCLESLALLDPPPLEAIVVIGDEFQGEPPNEDELEGSGLSIRVVHRGTGPFHFSRAVNCGLLASRGELVLLLNDDIEAETPDWLGRMAAHLDDVAIGAVGAALLYPDMTVQHVGVLIEDAQPLHPFRNHLLADTAIHGGDVARDVIGVTGACLLARRKDLMAIGGMSLEFPASYGDIDLCLRLRRSGLKVVVDPAAVLIHHESASREPVIEPHEWDRFIHRWGEVADPWYHPAFWRPNDLDHMTRNADHLGPVDTEGSWPARSADIQSKMHQSQMNLPKIAGPKMQT